MAERRGPGPRADRAGGHALVAEENPGDDAERRRLHLRREFDDPLRIDRRPRPERLDAGAVLGVDRADRPRQGRDARRIGVRRQGRLD